MILEICGVDRNVEMRQGKSRLDEEGAERIWGLGGMKLVERRPQVPRQDLGIYSQGN